MDEFEGVQDNLYACHVIEVLNHKTGQIERAVSYLLDDFKEELLHEKGSLFESYSSINDYYKEYKKFEDTPENTNSLLRQLKN